MPHITRSAGGETKPVVSKPVSQEPKCTFLAKAKPLHKTAISCKKRKGKDETCAKENLIARFFAETKQSPRNCRRCHSSYPHPRGWILKEAHSKSFLHNRQLCTNACHGQDMEGGLSGVSCKLCHEIYPHAESWNDPKSHGPVARQKGSEVCKVCHGNGETIGYSGIGCNSCHKPPQEKNPPTKKKSHP